MSDFDPQRQLVMAAFKRVHGFRLNAGRRLAVVDEPAVPGEVTEAMARRLYAAGIAVYAEDFSPTPIETKEGEAARLVEDMERAGDDAPLLDIPDDLAVTNRELLEIARHEGVAVESDDNKADLQGKIIAHRAARVPDQDAAPDTEIIG